MNKIIHIITRLDRGGSAQNTLLTCLGLAEKYDLVLVHGLSYESRMTDQEKKAVDQGIEEARKKGVKVVAIPSLVRKISLAKDFLAFFSLLKLIIKERPVIVHTHTSKAGILGRCAAKLAGVPIIVHTPHGHVFYGHFNFLISKFFLLVEKLMASITDSMIALTEGERKDHIELSVCGPGKIVTIHSGVELDHYATVGIDVQEKKRLLGLDPEKLIVGTIGWLLPIKGPMYLLKAMSVIWQIYPETGLIYVGKGEMEDDLKAEVDRMGIADKVDFLGWRDDIPEIMHVIDIFVLPSLNEGMGRVLIEAMAAGKPIVASDVGGIPDLVKQEENGLLVPAADAEALAKGIEFFIAHPEEREKMGNAGRKIAARYSSDSMVQMIDKLYGELLNNRTQADEK